MNFDKNIKWLLQHCGEMFEENVPVAVAGCLSLLFSGEEEGLISRKWRAQIDVESLTQYLKENLDDIETGWQKNYTQLKQILDYGGKMLSEETMLILHLRSNLEEYKRFLADKHENLLDSLDENLKDVLSINSENVRDSLYTSRRNNAAMNTYLHSHWWWHFDKK